MGLIDTIDEKRRYDAVLCKEFDITIILNTYVNKCLIYSDPQKYRPNIRLVSTKIYQLLTFGVTWLAIT